MIEVLAPACRGGVSRGADQVVMTIGMADREVREQAERLAQPADEHGQWIFGAMRQLMAYGDGGERPCQTAQSDDTHCGPDGAEFGLAAQDIDACDGTDGGTETEQIVGQPHIPGHQHDHGDAGQLAEILNGVEDPCLFIGRLFLVASGQKLADQQGANGAGEKRERPDSASQGDRDARQDDPGADEKSAVLPDCAHWCLLHARNQTGPSACATAS